MKTQIKINQQIQKYHIIDLFSQFQMLEDILAGKFLT